MEREVFLFLLSRKAGLRLNTRKLAGCLGLLLVCRHLDKRLKGARQANSLPWFVGEVSKTCKTTRQPKGRNTSYTLIHVSQI